MPKSTVVNLTSKDSSYLLNLDKLLDHLSQQRQRQTDLYQFHHTNLRMTGNAPSSGLPKNMKQIFGTINTHRTPFTGNRYNIYFWLNKAAELIEEEGHSSLEDALIKCCSTFIASTTKTHSRLMGLLNPCIQYDKNEHKKEQQTLCRIAYLTQRIAQIQQEADEMKKKSDPVSVQTLASLVSTSSGYHMELEWQNNQLKKLTAARPSAWAVREQLTHQLQTVAGEYALLQKLPADLVNVLTNKFPSFLSSKKPHPAQATFTGLAPFPFFRPIKTFVDDEFPEFTLKLTVKTEQHDSLQSTQETPVDPVSSTPKGIANDCAASQSFNESNKENTLPALAP